MDEDKGFEFVMMLFVKRSERILYGVQETVMVFVGAFWVLGFVES